MELLHVSDIHLSQGDFSLRGISFSVQQGQKMAITGETGSGKSTLLKVVGGLLDADNGSVLFEGSKVTGPLYNLVPGHKGITYLSQRSELRNHYRMEELLSYANALTEAQAANIFELCRIGHLLKRKTTGLSGGEMQRLALARLLVSAPRLLLLDEPFSNLDLIHKNILKEVIADVSNELGMTCILTSHDPFDTLPWADEIIVLKEGAVMQKGTPAQVYRQPGNEYVAGLFGSYNLLSATDIALFSGGSTLSANAMFIRPEQFQIIDDGAGLQGHISAILFYGSYDEITVQVGAVPILIKTLKKGFAVGDIVHVSLLPGIK